jgi:hypothetical protein
MKKPFLTSALDKLGSSLLPTQTDPNKVSVVSNITMICKKMNREIDTDALLSDQTSIEEVRALQDELIIEYNLSFDYEVMILETARIACEMIPYDLCDQMDISDSMLLIIKNKIQELTK